MTFSDIETLLAGRLGFDVQTVGTQAVEAVISRSMEAAGVSDPAAYARLVASDANAWNALVDRVVIPETWFFRDGAPFELAVGHALSRLSAAPGRMIRILSCPCSTGEEPYSLAMAMLHAGVPPESFVVDALDVNRRALESAQELVFRKRSFRNDGASYREEYFDGSEAGAMWQIKPYVASQVRFREGNLIAPDFLKDEEPYDIVLCRNLLIYLHPAARLIAMMSLRRLVAACGILVLGHAEAIFAREHGFRATGPPAAFAFARTVAPAFSKPQSISRREEPSNDVRPPLSIGANIASANQTALIVGDTAELAAARRLGDAGQLAEAFAACSEYLQRVPDSAEAHFLLGVFHDALGRPDLAARSFRKVLYLDPAHREALLHLALKQEALGDGSGAALLRARAQAAQDSSTSNP